MANYPLQDVGHHASSASGNFGPQADWQHTMVWKVGPTNMPLDPVLPDNATPAQIKEALELWSMPRDAYPKDGEYDVNYKLTKKGCKKRIYVHLRRQAFVTQPEHRQHSYFSFFQSHEYELGPVEDAIGIGMNIQHEGYNHCTATLAWGEAQMLAGWVDESYAVDWHNHFHSTRECEKLPIPPMLEEFILIHWPSMQDIGISMMKPDVMHIVDNGVRALADVDDIKQLHQEPDGEQDGEPDGVDVQQMVVQSASGDFADWQCVDGVCKDVKFDVDEDHPLQVSKAVKLEAGEDGITKDVDEPQHDSEWQMFG